MNAYTLIKRKPTVDELKRLHTSVGWHNIDDDGIQISLKNTLFSIVARHKDETIGLGRVIGDGAMYFYIQDIIVIPEHQGKGVGRMIMDAVMDYVNENARDHSFVGLMSAKDKAGFYEKYGFKVRGNDRPGMEIWWK